MLARMLLSEKLKPAMVSDSLEAAFLAPPLDEPQAPATRARTTAAAPTTRARCNRMGYSSLSLIFGCLACQAASTDVAAPTKGTFLSRWRRVRPLDTARRCA